jgi:hypothetical protein
MGATSENVEDPQSHRLYNPRFFIVLGLLFSFLLPGILYSINEGELKSRRWRTWLVVMFAGAFLGLVAVLIVGGDRLGTGARWGFLGINFGVSGLLYSLQSRSYTQWLSSGQKPRSVVVPVAIAAIPLTLLTIIAVLFIG